MGRPRILEFAIFATICSVPFSKASSIRLFERAPTCPDTTYNQCSSGLPTDFCCPPTSTCYTLAGNTTLLCCPPGGDCSTIKTVTCDIQFQNVTAHPDNILKTTVLTGTLSVCGSQCCPFGYTCSSGLCVLNADQSVAPVAAVSSSASSPGPTTSPSGTLSVVPTSTSTSTPSQETSNLPAPVGQACSKFPVDAILVGFFPGLVLGIVLASITTCLLGAACKSERRKSGSSFGNISDPQASTMGMRTDFLRKPPQTPSTSQGSSNASRRLTIHRVRSLFHKSPIASTDYAGGLIPSSQSPAAPPMPLNIRKPMMQQVTRPITPIAQRDPSFEDIDIYADGGTASALRERERQRESDHGLWPTFKDGRASHQTTFTDMMHTATTGSWDSNLAGLPKGQPYVYKGSRGT